MEYILINREGDAKIIADYKTSFETYTHQKLVEAYNKEATVEAQVNVITPVRNATKYQRKLSIFKSS